MKREQVLLYAITDRAWLGGRTLADVVEQAILGGVSMIQLREKEMDTEELIQSGSEIKSVCDKYGVPLIINDNVEAAKKLHASGVHLGQGDMPINKARAILGNDKIIGITAKTVEQAREAERNGADYIGSGAVFGTTTKSNAVKMELDTLRNITKSVNIPVAAIGGITEENIDKLQNTGISGVAVVSGIFAQNDIKKATEALFEKIKSIAGGK